VKICVCSLISKTSETTKCYFLKMVACVLFVVQSFFVMIMMFSIDGMNNKVVYNYIV
jgi:hypothetical protein